MPSRSIIRTGVGPHREPGNRFPAMAAAINLLAARAARVQSRPNLSRSLSPKLDHSHSITRFDRSRTGPKLLGLQPWPARLMFETSIPRLKDGGFEMIRPWIEAASTPRLVIIDTLAKVRDPKGHDQTGYEA